MIKNDLSDTELYDGFEGEALSDIWSHSRFEERAIEIQDKIVRKGKKALKMTLRSMDKFESGGGKFKDSERDELLERKEYGPLEGKAYEYSFSIYIPEDFPIVPTRLVIAQWKQDDGRASVLVDNPILALRYIDRKLSVTLQTKEEKETLFKTKEEVRGKWLDFVFQIKLTRKSTGFVRAWMNQKQIVDYKGITAYSERYNYPNPARFYFKMGLYRDLMKEPMTIYIDEYRKRVLK